MKADKALMLLYAVTDRAWLKGETLANQVEKAIKGGVTLVQLREKNLDDEAFLQQALEVKAVTDKYKIPLIINDNIDVALKCNAEGVHVGQSDLAAGVVRARLGESKIIGVSAQTVEQAVEAEKNGADYLGVGAVFSTSTKLDACEVSFETLKAITSAVSIPVVAIGGISEHNIMELQGSGIDGVAVVSAIFDQEHIVEAAKRLAALSKKMVDNK